MTVASRVVTTALLIGIANHAIGAATGLHALRYVMGTWCDLVVLNSSPNAEAVEASFQEIARLERVMSNWDAASEVSALNARAGNGPQPVSTDLAAVVREATDLCSLTAGAFDATVGSAVHAWGFDTESPRKPTSERARQAASPVGCDRIRVQTEPPAIALERGTRIDLGGIGKGYAVDRALAVLRAHGVTRAKLDFGSSSLGFVGQIDGGWPVVVADPRNRDRPLVSFRVSEGSVSTSGQREHSFIRNGQRYGHIFDPRTGLPVQSRLLLVTVIAPDAGLADGLSTALFVMGSTEGARLVSTLPDTAAIFVEERAGHDVTIVTTGRVDDLTRLDR